MPRICRLDNGVRFILMPRSKDTEVCIVIGLGYGASDESAYWSGALHFIEHLGAESYAARLTVARKLDKLHAIFNAYTSQDLTYWIIRVPPRNLTWALKLMCDLILTPEFSPRDFDYEREVIIEDMYEHMDDGEERLTLLRDRLIFNGHALSNPIMGRPATLRALTHERIMSYWQRLIDPRRLAITIVGRFDRARARSLIAEHFQQLTVPAHPLKTRLLQKPSLLRDRVMLRQHDSLRVNFLWTMMLPSYRSRLRIPLRILSAYLGAMHSSPLYLEGRKLGLTYSIGTEVWHYPELGFLKIDSGVSRQKLIPLLTMIDAVLRRTRECGLSRAEFELPRGEVLSATKQRFQEPSYVATLYAAQCLVHGQIESLELLRSRLAHTDRQQVNEVAKQALRAGNHYAVARGPLTRSDRRKIRALFAVRKGAR